MSGGGGADHTRKLAGARSMLVLGARGSGYSSGPVIYIGLYAYMYVHTFM